MPSFLFTVAFGTGTTVIYFGFHQPDETGGVRSSIEIAYWMHVRTVNCSFLAGEYFQSMNVP
jgi:hypothetical protein